MKKDYKEALQCLFEKHFKEKPKKFTALPPSGSNRLYFRIVSQNYSAIGTYNPDTKENKAFLHLANLFYKEKLPVPKIYEEQINKDIYLQEDLGNQTLFMLYKEDHSGRFTSKIKEYYKKTLQFLIEFQLLGSKADDRYFYPRKSFDRQSMQWDLNYFKYYFLKPAGIQFNEQSLEEDFQIFMDYLLQANMEYFMYRDFQARNIMLHQDKLFFIDFQGGRKGPLQYDVASLLFQVKADIPFGEREKLLDFYIEQLQQKIPINKAKFIEHYYGFVLMRLLQVLGAYGFRGLFEKKAHWISSIPYAQKNIDWFLENIELPVELPVLMQVLEKCANVPIGQDIQKSQLTVYINSFSYKRGIPVDISGHGGGFVFDCRALPNPGRQKFYRDYTGKDKQVIEYLENFKEVEEFKTMTNGLIRQAVENYLERGFTSLSVSFGCTGGQHRSVYFAEKLTKYLQKNYPVKIITKHLEQEKLW